MKNILVTGGARGIGKAITERLIVEGYKVFVVYHESDKQAQELLDKYGDTKISIIKANLAEPDDINSIIVKLKEIDLNGIVNNAGIVYLTKWEDLNFDEWDKTLAVNLTAPLRLVHGLRYNLRSESSIVNISSVDGYVAAFDTIAYAASKSALINVTKSLAAILGPKSIRVNAVAPGWVETEMTEGTMPEESRDLTPLKRNARTVEIANVVNFLLSDQSSFINGETITVDGGLTTVDYTLYLESK